MAGVEDHVVGDLGQPLEALGHQRRIAPGQVGPSTSVEEQRVARDQPSGDEEALAAGCVARRVHQLDIDRPDRHDVAGIVSGDIARRETRGSRDPRDLGALDVDRTRLTVEQRRDAFDVETHHRPADVVGVVVRRQHARHPHVVGRRGVEQLADRVRRIDEQALARGAVADQIGEVDHLRGDRVTHGEVTPRQQLTEVQLPAAVVVWPRRCWSSPRAA